MVTNSPHNAVELVLNQNGTSPADITIHVALVWCHQDARIFVGHRQIKRQRYMQQLSMIHWECGDEILFGKCFPDIGISVVVKIMVDPSPNGKALYVLG